LRSSSTPPRRLYDLQTIAAGLGEGVLTQLASLLHVDCARHPGAARRTAAGRPASEFRCWLARAANRPALSALPAPNRSIFRHLRAMVESRLPSAQKEPSSPTPPKGVLYFVPPSTGRRPAKFVCCWAAERSCQTPTAPGRGSSLAGCRIAIRQTVHHL